MRMLFGKGIRTKVLATFLSIILLVFVVSGVMINGYIQNLLLANIHDTLHKDSAMVASQVNLFFAKRRLDCM